MTISSRFELLPTAAKLLLILTVALLPIGIALAWLGENGIRQADAALKERSQIQAGASARAIEGLIARNALALRIAANGALSEGPKGACERTQRSLAIAPALAQNFELETVDGQPICSIGGFSGGQVMPLVAPGNIRVQIAPGNDGLTIRAGVIGGMITALVGVDELRNAGATAGTGVVNLKLKDAAQELQIVSPPDGDDFRANVTDWPLGNGGLRASVGTVSARVTTGDRLMLLLPLLMWVAAALISWVLVSRLLIKPLRRLEQAVIAYRPGEPSLDLPSKLGPSAEIQELRNAFVRAIDRVEKSEREASGALEGQRKLVREVHHRVKNNLQVIASLLNIHGRGTHTPEARAAYASISRRVGALSIVHRNHYAEMEESRGIALRPLVTELVAELRASAPTAERGFAIELDLDSVHTTQDVAVAVSFLITEILEYSMLNAAQSAVELSLRRKSELTARLSLSSPVLLPDQNGDPGKDQFERIVSGLAKQLRSSLDRKVGRYSVDLPVFPSS